MTLDNAIRQLLLSMPPVTALVAARVYVLHLPQSPTLPAVRVQTIDEHEPIHLRGPGNLRRARVQVDSIGKEGAAAVELDAAVHGDGVSTGLRCFRGLVGTLLIDLIDPVDRRPAYDAEELRQYKVLRDYFAWFREV